MADGYGQRWITAGETLYRDRLAVAVVTVAKEIQGEHRIEASNQKIITNISNFNPGQVTSPAHGLSQGEEILLMDTVGMPTLNNRRYVVGFLSADAFDLRNLDNSNLDTTSVALFGAYASGGVAGSIFMTEVEHAKRASLAQEVLHAFAFTGGTMTAMGTPKWLDTFALAVAALPAVGDVTPVTHALPPDETIKNEVIAVWPDVAGITGADLL